MDMADLYDYEIMKVGKIAHELSEQFSKRTNNQMNLSELAKKAEDKFREAGFIVHVDYAPLLTGGSPVIEIIDRVSTTVEAKQEFDHDRKRWEVLGGNARGEKFRGEKEKYKA